MEKAVNFKIIILFIVVVALFFSFIENISAQQTPLNKRISLNVSNTTIQNVLKKIGEKVNFNFSYNSEIIDKNKTVTINTQNSTVESILKNILNKNIQYKVVGNHIVLLGKTETKNKETKNTGYFITGYIVDSSTGKKIHSATIYDIEGKTTCITNSEGYYSISIPANKEFRGLTYCKKGYLDTVIIIKPSEIENIDMQLKPKMKSIDKIPVKEITPLPYEFDNQRLVNWVVPPVALSHSNNLILYEKRIGQVSFLPFPGLHTSVKGVIVNNVSLNVLAGFSDGVEGVEIGGLLNIDKSYVKGFQAGGIGNIVGKKTSGVQIAGLFNINTGSITGVQVAGFNNVVNDTITGVQIAGFTNLLRGKMNGIQIAGFYNHTTKDVDGFQIGGFMNVAEKNVDDGQIAGFFNFSGQNIEGIQIAGFFNYAVKDNNGVQISGFINKAKSIKGLQISFINVSDTSSGYSIGFFNHVKKGYRAIEISSDEIFYGNLSYKTGNKKLYNIYNLGLQSVKNKIWSVGFGFGSYFNLSNKFIMSVDLTANAVNENMFWQDHLNLLNKLAISLDYKLSPKLALFASPSYNVHVSSLKNAETNSFTTDIAFNPFLEKSTSTTQTQMWIGGKVGIRIILSRN